MLMGAIYVGRPRLAMSLALAALAASGPRLLMRKHEEERIQAGEKTARPRLCTSIIADYSASTYDRG
jgi:hypothetical protein